MAKFKNYVKFLSPGTFVSETSVKEIDSWDVKKAVDMALKITERYNSKPYGFTFSKKAYPDNQIEDKDGFIFETNPILVGTSGIHYITGIIRTYDDVLKDDKKDEEILRSNMRCNGWWVIIENNNSYKSTHAFNEEDCMVGWNGDVLVSSDYYSEYREEAQKKYGYND